MSQRKDYFDLLTFDEQVKYKKEYFRQNKLPLCNHSSNENPESFEEFLEGKCTSFKQFISQGFVHDGSKEGYFYWFNMSNRNYALPDWVKVYYNDVDYTDANNLIIKPGCRYFKLPKNFADAIAEDLLLQNLITSYIIKNE